MFYKWLKKEDLKRQDLATEDKKYLHSGFIFHLSVPKHIHTTL